MRQRLVLAVVLAAGCSGKADGPSQVPTSGSNPPPSSNASVVCDAGNGGMTLPAGFCATVFADNVGIARHIAVTPSGDVYVMLSGGAVLALRDTNADGHSDLRASFGRSGNSGLALRGSDLYADVGTAIVRYHLTTGVLTPSGAVDTIVRGLPTGGHGTRSVALSAAGDLFVNVGSASNICDGGLRDPCFELPTRAGIWRFDATLVGQTFASSARYATGIRNAVGITINTADGRLYALQHGRDNLYQSYPQLFSAQDGAENPAEELFQVNPGDDFGWPYCYYDFRAGQRVLGPELGGNRQTVGRCAATKAAQTVFPGHCAPNGIVFYGGTSFPQHYRGGAFVAFHGSWNRAPVAQAGFLVAFVPAAAGGLASTYEVFADGLAGGGVIADPLQAAHRPTGLAVDPSGALYVTDDKAGRIWRIVYRGP